MNGNVLVPAIECLRYSLRFLPLPLDLACSCFFVAVVAIVLVLVVVALPLGSLTRLARLAIIFKIRFELFGTGKRRIAYGLRQVGQSTR